MFRVSLEKHSGVNSQQLAPRKPLEQGSQTCLAPTSHCTFYTPSQPSFLPTLQLQQGNALLSTLLSAHYGHICHYIATYCFKHYKKENSVMRKKNPSSCFEVHSCSSAETHFYTPVISSCLSLCVLCLVRVTIFQRHMITCRDCLHTCHFLYCLRSLFNCFPVVVHLTWFQLSAIELSVCVRERYGVGSGYGLLSSTTAKVGSQHRS